MDGIGDYCVKEKKLGIEGKYGFIYLWKLKCLFGKYEVK